MKKRWRRAPRQILRRDMECRRPHPLVKTAAILRKELTKAVNALAKGCIAFRDAFCRAMLEDRQRR